MDILKKLEREGKEYKEMAKLYKECGHNDIEEIIEFHMPKTSAQSLREPSRGS